MDFNDEGSYAPVATAKVVEPLEIAEPDSLPPHVAEVARLRGNVIAWTHVDPALAPKVFKSLLLKAAAPFLILPCSWPALPIVLPVFWCQAYHDNGNACNQYWILTDRELKVVTLDHDRVCIPNLWRSGASVQTIPLENITDSGLEGQGNGCGNKCVGDVHSVYVDTAGGTRVVEPGTAQQHEATGIALENAEWFIDQVLNARDALNGRACAPTVVSQAMVREDAPTRSAKERIEEAKGLMESGLLTESEYGAKRQQILSSI